MFKRQLAAAVGKGHCPVLTAFLACVLFLPGGAWAADDLMNHLAAHAWGELAGRAVDDFMNLAKEKAKFNTQIALARQTFFREHPDGENLEAARKQFNALLLGKDMMYLSFGAVAGLDKPRDRRRFMQSGTVGQSGVGGRLDGGVNLLARPAFIKLVTAMRADIKADNRAKRGSDGDFHGSLMVLPASFHAALKKNKEAFETYLLFRNYDEYLRAGERMSAYDDPQAYSILMLRLYRGQTASQALANYETLRRVMGEKAVAQAAHQAAAVPQNRTGRLTDLARLGLSLPARRPRGDNRPTSPDTEGKTIIPNASPITVLRALWRRDSRGDLLIEIAEDRDLSYAGAENLLLKLAAALGQTSLQYDDPRTYVMLTLLRDAEVDVSEAVAGYEALRQAVGEKRLLEAARKVAAIPMDGIGNLTDLKALGLVRYRELWGRQSELPSGRAADGRIAVKWALPQFAMRALWCRDNPQAYAVQLIADSRIIGYDKAWRSYRAIESLVGREKLLSVARAVYAAPKRVGGESYRKRQYRGLLVTPVPPGDELYMWRPAYKLQSDLLAGRDLKFQIRYFIALDTGDVQSIDKTYQALAKIKGEKALLAAAEQLRVAGWQTPPKESVVSLLPYIIRGKYDPNAGKRMEERMEKQVKRMIQQKAAAAAAKAAAEAEK